MKHNKRHPKLHIPTIVSAFVKHPYIILITLMLPTMIAIYHLGGDNMAAKKDREFMDRTIDINRQYQKELNAKQKNAMNGKRNIFSILRDLIIQLIIAPNEYIYWPILNVISTCEPPKFLI